MPATTLARQLAATDNAARNKADALQLLTVMSDYGASQKLMLDALRFNFGDTATQAEAMYQDWTKQP